MLHRILGVSFIAFAALLVALITRKTEDSVEGKFWLEQIMFVYKVMNYK